MLARSTNQALLARNQIFCQKVFKRTHHCEPASPLFDWRRRRDRSHWCPVKGDVSDQLDYVGYGFHGYDVELNWTLSAESVHPHHQAFRNLHSRGLGMYFEGTKDKNHALHTTIQSKPLQTFYKLATKEELEAEWKANTQRWQDLVEVDIAYKMDQEGLTQELLDGYYKSREEAVGEEKAAIDREHQEFVSRYLRPQEEESHPLPDWSAVPNNAAPVSSQTAKSFPRDLRLFMSSFQDKIFVEDGILGSDPRTELRVRLITNSPNMAHTFSNMVFKTSKRVGSQEYRPPLTIIHSHDFLETNPASKYGIEGDQELSFLDMVKGHLFVAGRSVEDASVLRSLLAKSSFSCFPNRSILPLPAYVLASSVSAPPVLVLHNPENPLLEKFFNEQGNKNVYAQQHAIWSEHGISSLLSDLPTRTPQRGDLVQHIVKNNKEERVNFVVRRSGVPTVLPHPQKIVVVSNSDSGSGSSPAELITQHLTQNFSSFPLRADKWAEALNKNIEKHQVKVEKITLKSASDLKNSLSSVLA